MISRATAAMGCMVVGLWTVFGLSCKGRSRADTNLASAADKTPPQTLHLNETAPWKLWGQADEHKACPTEDGWLTPRLDLNAQNRKLLIRLDLADIPGLDGCAPVRLEELAVTLDAPAGLVGSHHAPSGWCLFWVDENWQWHEPSPGGWSNMHRGQQQRSLPKNCSADTTALGLYVAINDNAPPHFGFRGEVRIRIDKLVLHPGRRRGPALPEKGQVEIRPEESGKWSLVRSYGGGVSVRPAEGAAALNCDLDASDPQKRSAAAKLDIRRPDGQPIDMRERGVFLVVDVPRGLVTAEKFKCGLHAGVYSGREVFWGPWQAITHSGDVPLALYPETRVPLPLAFRSAGFDPLKVDAIALRVTADQGTRLRFKGPVTIRAAEIVGAPQALLSRRDRAAGRLGRKFPPAPARAEAGGVSLKEFLRNIGVNYPWPLDDRGEGIYPVVGAKVYTRRNKVGGLELRRQAIAEDFRMLAAHRICLVRVWLFGDLRRGFEKDAAGRFVMKPNCLRDLDILLAEARAAGVELIPVLFDFSVADGQDRERLAKVGEEAEVLTNPAVRGQFLDCIEPVLKKLCGSPAVRMIDLWNEPGQMCVPMDRVVETVAALADRVGRLPGGKPVTVGVRNSVELPFWMRAKIDVPTFHWFAKMEADRYPKAWAPKGVIRRDTIVTEIEATGGVAATLTELRQAGFRGGLIWSVNAKDGVSAFGPKQAAEFLQWVRKQEGASGR